MGDTTAISWCDATFNGWEGCTKVSAGCANCYAETRNKRFDGGNWGKGAPRRRTVASNWRKPLSWDRKAKLAGTRPRVFCSSLSDVFDEEVSDVWRLELFHLIRSTPNLDWLLLTKRPQNIKRHLSAAIDAFVRTPDVPMETVDWLQAWVDGTPPPNVWLGTTVENQEAADVRIPLLLSVPAAVRFLSCEPLLGPLDLSKWLGQLWKCSKCAYDWKAANTTAKQSESFCASCADKTAQFVPNVKMGQGLHWVIVGGESGSKARAFDLSWARSIVEQCRAAKVTPFVKQMGDNPISNVDSDLCGRMGPMHGKALKDQPTYFSVLFKEHHGAVPAEWPTELQIQEFPR